jgi:AraC family transcriptional regulator, transcriptional activator of pobA
MSIPEVSLKDGARMFMASHSLAELPQTGAHRYAFYALAWLSGGPAVLMCDTVRFEVPAGSLVFITPGQVHWWEAAAHEESQAARQQTQPHLSLLGFLPEVFTGRLLDVRLITELPFFRVDGTTVLTAPDGLREALGGLFRQAAQRYQHLATGEADKDFLTLPRQAEGLLLAYLHAILAEAATAEPASVHSDAAHSDSAHPEGVSLTLAHSADVRLARLFRLHAEGNVDRRHPVGHYAELLNVTPDHLTRAVRRVTGKTPIVWLQERLLLEARRLLTFTDQPIECIAENLNFPTPTQFSQWFRSRSGQTPRDVRRTRTATSDFQQF